MIDLTLAHIAEIVGGELVDVSAEDAADIRVSDWERATYLAPL